MESFETEVRQQPLNREIPKPFFSLKLKILIVAVAVGFIMLIAVAMSQLFGPLRCSIEFCEVVHVAEGTKSCDEPTVTCSKCTEGYKTSGQYCALDCRIDGCSDVNVEKGTASCTAGVSDGHVTCTECEEDHEFAVDNSFNYLKSIPCVRRCTDQQKWQGCALGQCTSSTECTCAPGYIQAGASCTKPTSTVKMELYMYRATRSESFHPENINLATAGGVLWYLHNEVVRVCPRHYDIVRIDRYKATIQNPQKVFAARQGQWGHFTQFDYGQCTVANCPSWWQNFGYMAGCQEATYKTGKNYPWYKSRFSQAYWYSLPGRCPSKTFGDQAQDPHCAARELGGECPKPEINGVANRGLDGILPESMPDGSDNCVWKLEPAGHVTLDELAGCQGGDWAWCNAGNREYVVEADKGIGCTWWDNRSSDEANEERTRLLLAKFAEKYPEMPSLFDPLCDGF